MNKRIFFFVLLVAAIFPLGYLFYRSSQAGRLKDIPPVAVSSAIPVLEDSARINPSFNNLLALASAYINANTPGKSVDLLKQAVKLQPASAAAWNDLGVAYTMLQQYGKGIEACKAALTIDPQFALAKNNLAWAETEAGKVKDRIAGMEAVPSSQRSAETETARGLAYLSLSDYDTAIRIWSDIVNKNPKDLAAVNNIGTAFVLKEQYDDAIALFNKIIQEDPANQLAKNNLAWAMDEKNTQISR